MSINAEADKMIELLRTIKELSEKIHIQAETLNQCSTIPLVKEACREVEYFIWGVQNMYDINRMDEAIRIIEENKDS
jgi:hypothetical protein